MKVENMLFRKPCLSIFKKLNNYEEINKSKIAREIDVTYSYTVKILNVLKKEDFIYFKKQGRESLVFLTEKGIKLQWLILSIEEIFIK